jgi:16S rRNA (cytosine1402-N4)-methyltransferase
MDEAVHVPVLAREILELLDIKPASRVLDATVGLGGHSRAILRAAPEVSLLGLDRDEQALALAGERLAEFGDRVALRRMRFSHFPEALDELGWDGLDAAMADLGVSSMQLDDPERGFSFLADGPLDMRMGASDGLAPAGRLVNKASFEELRRIIGEFGEDPMAGRIARAIKAAREKHPIETTAELAGIVEAAYPAKWRALARNHPATRTFQALRMAVNRELEDLADFLARIVDFLKPGARLAVISFHSLEDRMVKQAFRREASGCVCPPQAARCVCRGEPRLAILTKKPITASSQEVFDNPRSRSAKLRAAERLPGLPAGDAGGLK